MSVLIDCACTPYRTCIDKTAGLLLASCSHFQCPISAPEKRYRAAPLSHRRLSVTSAFHWWTWATRMMPRTWKRKGVALALVKRGGRRVKVENAPSVSAVFVLVTVVTDENEHEAEGEERRRKKKQKEEKEPDKEDTLGGPGVIDQGFCMVMALPEAIPHFHHLLLPPSSTELTRFTTHSPID
jgi:hypothetical protein